MKRDPDSRLVSRRQFLKQSGAAAGGLLLGALACGRTTPMPSPQAQKSLPQVITATPPGVTSIPASPSVTPIPTSELVPRELAADTILVNANVITVDTEDSVVEAVAVKDGKFLTVGSNETVLASLGEETQLIDLGGKAVTPGFIDPHNHFQVMGLMHNFFVPFMPPEVTTVAQLQEKLAEVVANTKEGEWIQGYFLVVTEGRLPDRHDLDPVSPDHPVWIMQQGGHYGSANSLALQLAEISADTPDPVGGVIERDDRGEPTGVFYNHRAMDLLRRVAPRYSMETVRENIRNTQPMFAACGVTTFHDNNVRGVDTVAQYLQADRDGDLSLQGAVYYTLEWPSDVDRALKEIDYYQGDMMRFAGFKFLLDGQLKMAYCHAPHNGVRWDTPTWEPETFKEAVRLLHDTGLQISVHCAGDATADLALDAFEAAMNANPRPDPRHRIEHAILTTPQATQRMKDLGVVVCTQPQFIRLGGDLYAGLFGEERTRRTIVTREWLDEGVSLALSSDSPTTPWYTPQVTLFGAVTRVTFSNKQHNPEQCLTVKEALRAHTMGGAYAGHEENSKGSIEVGKQADLAVWRENPLTSAVSGLWQMPIDMTMVRGATVYQDATAGLTWKRAEDWI